MELDAVSNGLVAALVQVCLAMHLRCLRPAMRDDELADHTQRLPAQG